jgi:isopenicillin-N N-acyltransferase-like protein
MSTDYEGAMSEGPARFPIVRVSATDPLERGRAIGEEARAQVRESIAAYEETFAHYTGLGWEEVTELALEFEAPIAAYDADILAEIHGIAEGSGSTYGELLAVNARSEIMFGLWAKTPPECTSFFAAGTATVDGHVLLGQNWDWRPRAIESTMLFVVDQGPDLPAFTMLAEAGLVGKTGFNEHGVGVTLNAMVSARDIGERATPIHVILRGILNSTTAEEALAAIVRMRRGASANYTIASATGVGVAVEAGPGGIESVSIVPPTAGILGHSNHFRTAIDYGDVGAERWADSATRLETMSTFLETTSGALDSEAAKGILRDDRGHPDAICRFPNPDDHPVERVATVASIVMDLTALTAEVAVGPPSESEFVPFAPAFDADRT